MTASTRSGRVCRGTAVPGCGPCECGVEGIERAGADVAAGEAEGAEGQGAKISLLMPPHYRQLLNKAVQSVARAPRINGAVRWKRNLLQFAGCDRILRFRDVRRLAPMPSPISHAARKSATIHIKFPGPFGNLRRRVSGCRMKRLHVTIATVVALAIPCLAWAADWPTKPVRIVVPWAAGGSADALGRIFAEQLGQAFHQSFVVENEPGAGGLVGSVAVAHADPDGYTFLVSGIGSSVTAPIISASPP